MDISYQRSLKQSYMIVEGEENNSSFIDKMLRANQIDAFLSGYSTNNNGKSRHWFDITGKKSVEDFFDQEGVSRHTINVFFEGLSKAFALLEEYLIGVNSVLWDIKTIFMSQNAKEWEVFLCYAPVRHHSFESALQSLAEYWISHVDNNHEENVKLCYQIYEEVLKQDVQLSHLLGLVREEICDDIHEVGAEEVFRAEEEDWEEYILHEDEAEDVEEEHRSLKAWLGGFFHKDKKKRRILFDKEDWEDFIFDPDPLSMDENHALYDGATTFLSMEERFQGRLVYKGSGHMSDIIIDRTPFSIGSRTQGNDAVIAMPEISRCHARITEDNGVYYIEDLHSKNGTFLNGSIIGYHEVIRLKPGDMIGFAGVMYQFL